ncbi:DNA alkylation repair protein [Glaciecola siphonariae]|uniref:DNA alkylation repair protein n=1 Tax=Glaciecola siphonariae TaxID=521012 RepID=A0ABV9M0T3_9ALTE
MPEPFKNLFSHELIEQMGACFAAGHRGFDEQSFVKLAGQNLDTLELKQRSDQIVQAMHQCLPRDFAQTEEILLNSLRPMVNDQVCTASNTAHLLHGWAIMPMAEYVGMHGQGDFNRSMTLLYQMTQRFSAEFAIRYFLKEQESKTLAKLQSWLSDPSEHVRRLVSEGTRPRLPWGMQLRSFVKNPEPLLPILDALKDDSAEYVRRSVANNLNDIAKDHPQIVIDTAKRWLENASNDRTRLVKHACRTLLKKGMPQALSLFGFKQPEQVSVSLTLSKRAVAVGESIDLLVEISSGHANAQQIMLDYVVHHKKANGQLLPKVFKWKTLTLAPYGTIDITKSHSFKPVTTRKYYAGEHQVSLLINGVAHCAESFVLN